MALQLAIVALLIMLLLQTIRRARYGNSLLLLTHFSPLSSVHAQHFHFPNNKHHLVPTCLFYTLLFNAGLHRPLLFRWLCDLPQWKILYVWQLFGFFDRSPFKPCVSGKDNMHSGWLFSNIYAAHITPHPFTVPILHNGLRTHVLPFCLPSLSVLYSLAHSFSYDWLFIAVIRGRLRQYQLRLPTRTIDLPQLQ